MDILVPKTGVLQICPEIQNGDFIENDSNDFNYISAIYRDHLPK
jgi:hypothetical protein